MLVVRNAHAPFDCVTIAAFFRLCYIECGLNQVKVTLLSRLRGGVKDLHGNGCGLFVRLS